jgi:hypothetical protein
MNQVNPPENVTQSLIKKFIGTDDASKYTINIFVVTPDQASAIVANSGASITTVQYVEPKEQPNDSLTNLNDVRYKGDISKIFNNVSAAYAEYNLTKPTPWSWYAVNGTGKISATLLWDHNGGQGEDDQSVTHTINYAKHGKLFVDALESSGIGTKLSVVRGSRDFEKDNQVTRNIRLDNIKLVLESIEVDGDKRIVSFRKEAPAMDPFGNITPALEVEPESVEAITETRQEKKIRLKALRASLIHKAVGQQFSMVRYGHTATFTVTKDGKFLGENGVEYNSPSRACGGIWESKGADGFLSCNGYTCTNKEGLTIDEVLGISE